MLRKIGFAIASIIYFAIALEVFRLYVNGVIGTLFLFFIIPACFLFLFWNRNEGNRFKFDKIGLFILGVIIPFLFTRFPAPYSVICFFIIPLSVAIALWKRSRPFAVGLLSTIVVVPIFFLVIVGLFNFSFGVTAGPDYKIAQQVIEEVEQYKLKNGKYPTESQIKQRGGVSYYYYPEKDQYVIASHWFGYYSDKKNFTFY